MTPGRTGGCPLRVLRATRVPLPALTSPHPHRSSPCLHRSPPPPHAAALPAAPRPFSRPRACRSPPVPAPGASRTAVTCRTQTPPPPTQRCHVDRRPGTAGRGNGAAPCRPSLTAHGRAARRGVCSRGNGSLGWLMSASLYLSGHWGAAVGRRKKRES